MGWEAQELWCVGRRKAIDSDGGTDVSRVVGGKKGGCVGVGSGMRTHPDPGPAGPVPARQMAHGSDGTPPHLGCSDFELRVKY